MTNIKTVYVLFPVKVRLLDNKVCDVEMPTHKQIEDILCDPSDPAYYKDMHNSYYDAITKLADMKTTYKDD